METYIPTLIETKDVFLPLELCSLVEELAQNYHDRWALERISQGWTYGERRNDTFKTHPCLVPYELLPEEEKEYVRNASVNTLKLIIKLGFKISQ